MTPASALLIALRDARSTSSPDRPRVLLTGPTGPDGDSLGACLALQRALRRLGVDADVAGTAPYRYAWLPGANSMVPDEQVGPSYGAVVILDGDRHRLPRPVEEAFAAAPVRAIVDHHQSTRPDGYTHAWIDPAAESTCGMLLGAFAPDEWDVPLDADLATLLYAGLVFDTGGFRYSNTTPQTHRAAARLLAAGVDHVAVCARMFAERRAEGVLATGEILSSARWLHGGALCVSRVTSELQRRLELVEGDLEGVVDALVHAIGTHVAALLIERADGSVRVSLRSRGNVDVAAVAAAVAATGGGHRKAAGATVRGTLDEVEAHIARSVAEQGGAVERAT
jgi:phosphoesterase RecJ-like protein